MKTLYCFYDMAVNPCSYDFFVYLYSAETCRIRRNLEKIQLIFIHGPNEKFRQDNIRSIEQNETFFNNVIIPGISLLPSCSSFMWCARDQFSFEGIKEKCTFPRGYSLQNPTMDYVARAHVASMLRKDSHGFFEAPSYAKSIADNLLRGRCSDNKFITVTAREIERDNANNTRTLNPIVWKNAIHTLSLLGIKTFVIRDTASVGKSPMFEGVEELPEASVHLPLRLAIYERSLVNFTKNNGPAALMLYSRARAVCFTDFDNDVVAVSENWFQSIFGVKKGGQFPFTTQSKLAVWGDESEKRIVYEVKQALNSVPENTLLNTFSNEDSLRSSVVVGFKYLIEQLKHGLLPEDVDLLLQIKKLNKEYNLRYDFDAELAKLSGSPIKQGIVPLLIKKTSIN